MRAVVAECQNPGNPKRISSKSLPSRKRKSCNHTDIFCDDKILGSGESISPSMDGGRFDHLQRLQSSMEILSQHNILENVMMFLDEVDLYQFENAYIESIGVHTFARQWNRLHIDEKERKIFSHKRWRDPNEDDIAAVVSESVSDDFKRLLVARRIGREFACEAMFVANRENEARELYDFDFIPRNEEDVPLSSLHTPLFQDKHKHWQEWYDYRLNSVKNKDAFVRLSLCGGSGRFWQGFRRLKTGHQKTFFRFTFDMRELIRDMDWVEMERYIHLSDQEFDHETTNSAMEMLMKMTQLTVSLDGKLLIATGGYSHASVRDSLNIGRNCYFHPRHYKKPLSSTTENELKWKPYSAFLEHDAERNRIIIHFQCDHTDLPFMRPEDIGNPNAHAHW